MPSRPSSPSHHLEGTPSPASYNPWPDSATSDHNSSPQAMGKQHNSLDIALASDYLYFRGTGVDVEPCTLQGHVVLNLVEATAFKEITMQFRGKSRVPSMQTEGPSVLGGSYQTNVIFIYDWSFLEGDRRHTPTLKAGRHVFPFQLQLEGWLPSSIALHGGLAGISYKLRATAVRPGFSPNLHAVAPVHIVRSFATEALEYQQTLEVENTWPEKMMYSIMVPHKAWAAGDTVSILLKASPLLKGVRITNITSTIQEHVKTYSRTGLPHEETHVTAIAKHEIRNGQAVALQLSGRPKDPSIPQRSTPPGSGPSSPSATESHIFPEEAGLSVPPIITENGESRLPGSSDSHASPTSGPVNGSIDLGEEEIVTTVPLHIPPSTVPSHHFEPIIVTHRIRWSILMTNPDGHMSELRCSLPLHILHHVLLDDARAATRATRRLLFGLDVSHPHTRADELELPSYPAHVLDRVANAYVSAPAPAPNRPPHPWTGESPLPSPGSWPSGSGSRTPPSAASELPPGTVALDWVNSELHRLDRVGRAGTTPPDSTQTSRHASRASSRAASPERAAGRPHHHHGHGSHSIFSLKPFAKVASSLHPAMSRHHSSDGQAARHAAPHEVSAPASASAFPRVASEGELQGMALRSRAFSEVPDYNVASRGFLGGGVTPLSSVRGLPSYEEAERSHGAGDLTTMART